MFFGPKFYCNPFVWSLAISELFSFYSTPMSKTNSRLLMAQIGGHRKILTLKKTRLYQLRRTINHGRKGLESFAWTAKDSSRPPLSFGTNFRAKADFVAELQWFQYGQISFFQGHEKCLCSLIWAIRGRELVFDIGVELKEHSSDIARDHTNGLQ